MGALRIAARLKERGERVQFLRLTVQTMEISEDDLKKLRARCVAEVKRTSGSISLSDAVRFQKGTL